MTDDTPSFAEYHTFEDAGFDTCRFCGERKSHASHGVAQTQSQPVAWRYQMKEGWDGIWRVVTVFPTFESPLHWRVEPLYAALAPGNGAVEPFELCEEWREELRRKYGRREFSIDEINAFLAGAKAALAAPSPAALDPVTVEACASLVYGFNAACNSPDMKAFVDADVVQAVYNRDFKIGDAIRALIGQPSSRVSSTNEASS